MSIAAAVLDAVRAEAAMHAGSRAARAGLQVGELSGVEPESLRFCLECLVSGSDLEPLAFEIELKPWTRRCLSCGQEFRVNEANPGCTFCGSRETVAAGGDELQLSYLELEEP
jgi:hydrogenase nickel incorporation protein HypA/HybF